MPWQRKEVPEVGVACLVFFFIHTEMDAIFQPIKKSDTYQIKLYSFSSKRRCRDIAVTSNRRAHVMTLRFPAKFTCQVTYIYILIVYGLQ